MANLSDDDLRWSLEINGNPALKSLSELEQSTRSLEQTNKQLRVEMQKLEAAGKKNSQEYKELDQQIKKNGVTITTNKGKMGEMRKEIGINGLTVQQLRTEYRHLKIQMDNTTPNTPAWHKYNEQLKAVKDRQAELNTGTHKANSLFGGLKALLPALGITAVITGLVKLGKEFLNIATSMEQTERKAKIVFGESLPMVTKAAAENAKQLGLTRNEFIKAAASTADLLVPLGFARDRSADLSVKLTNLSGALDEWSGGTLGAAQVNEILTKAMLGEAEQIKQLGIVIDQSSQDYNKRIKVMMETEGVTKEQARALDILNQIYQKSADAQTAFAQKGESLLRTQKSLSTWWKQLKENVVEWFEIPTATKIEEERRGLNTLVNSIIAVNDDQQTRNRLIKELQNSYPAFLQNLNLETLTNEQLAKKLKDVNEQYDNRVAKAVYEEQMSDVTEKQRKNFEKTDETLTHIVDLYQAYVKNKKEGASVDEMINSLLKDDLNVFATQEVGLRGNITLAVMKYNKLKERSIELEEKYDKIKDKRDKEEPKTEAPETSPLPLTEGQTADYYEAVKSGVIKGEGAVRALTQQELDKLSDVRKQKEDERLRMQQDAAEDRKRQSEAEAAEQKRLAEQQAAEQKRLLESQEATRQQIIRGSLTLIEKENLDYQDRLQAAGLYGMKREEMTDEELLALQILQREHQENIKEINDRSFNDNLNDMSVQYEREKTARERKHNEEILALGTNEEAKKALTAKYQRDELQKQADHLKAIVAQYEQELSVGTISGIFGSIPDLSEVLLSDDERTALLAKIDELKAKLAELGVAMAELDNAGKGEIEEKDIFGMTDDDWGRFNKKFQMAMSLARDASDMWAGLNRIQANKDRSELQQFEANTSKRKKLLDQQLRDQLISQQQYDQAIATMDAVTEQRKMKIAQDAARREKSQAYFSTVINTAAAVVNALATTRPVFPLGLIIAALIAAKGAIELGVIASEPLPQMQEGGFVNVTGKDDKKQYRAMMAPDKRGLVKGPTILVAEDKPEYVVPGRLLESNPTVKKYVDEIETIRTGRQFQNGGYTQEGAYRVPENLINEDRNVQKYVYVIEKISTASEKVDTRGIESIYEFYQKEINDLQKEKSDSMTRETEQIQQINTLQKEKSDSITREMEQIRQVNTLQKDRIQTIMDTSTTEKQIEKESRETSLKEKEVKDQELKLYTQRTRELITQREELVTSFINETSRIKEVSSTIKESLTGIGSIEVMMPKVIQPAPYVTTLSQAPVASSREMVTNNNTTVEKAYTDPQLIEALNRFSQIMEQIDRNGLEVPWVKIKEKFDQYDQIQSRVNTR